MTGLTDKHFVVTGGGSGIGAAIARLLDEAGARTTLVGRNAARVEELAAALVHGFSAPADVTKRHEVEAAFAACVRRHGPIAGLINNAGVAPSAPFLKTDDALWDEAISVNLTGAYHCAQAVLPGMIENGWGRIVNVASTAGLKGYPYVTAYCAAKHGVVGLTRALAHEVARHGVTVNAVCPGFTETAIVEDSIARIVEKTGATEDQARSRLAAHNPMGRLITPDEVAASVLWLCSNAASGVNGSILTVAGGEIG